MGRLPDASRLAARLARGGVVVLDGGMGSSVEDRGFDVRQALWGSGVLLDAAGRALNDEVHRAFRAAGAELLLTNTHNARRDACLEFLRQGSTERFEPALRKRLDALEDALEDAREDTGKRADALCAWVNEQAVVSLRRAVDADALLGGSLSSPKQAYAATGPPPEEVARHLRPQLAELVRHDLDLLVFELLTTADDLRGVQLLIDEHGLEHAAVGLTCGADGRTLGGVPMDEAVALAPGSAVWFVQCTRFDHVQAALEPLVAALEPGAVVGVYANDSRTWKDGAWHGARISPDAYGAAAAEWIAAGARIVGGCCGTTPAHVAALRQLFAR